MVKTVSFKCLILPAVLPQVSLIVVRGLPAFWRSPGADTLMSLSGQKTSFLFNIFAFVKAVVR
jgi:hypothetical protein